jgi:hypothetical protein
MQPSLYELQVGLIYSYNLVLDSTTKNTIIGYVLSEAVYLKLLLDHISIVI